MVWIEICSATRHFIAVAVVIPYLPRIIQIEYVFTSFLELLRKIIRNNSRLRWRIIKIHMLINNCIGIRTAACDKSRFAVTSDHSFTPCAAVIPMLYFGKTVREITLFVQRLFIPFIRKESFRYRSRLCFFRQYSAGYRDSCRQC